MRAGSLCSGILGLDLAVVDLYGAELAFVAETDRHACAVLDVRAPGVPNLGDVREVELPPVDVLVAGFPCQPVSQAGRKRGSKDERWLWEAIADAVSDMERRPERIVLENVRGLLTTNGGDAISRVVSRLADLGYVGSWRCLRAESVGAPHVRERWFALGVRDVEGEGPPYSGRGGRYPRGRHDEVLASSVGRAGSRIGGPGAPPYSDREGRGPDGRSRSAGLVAESARGSLSNGRSREGTTARVDLVERFGEYAAAIERWEDVLGRRAPDPLDDGQLSARFVEWMMGLPSGWVTDVLPRIQSIRVLGNGVVPQQAYRALVELERDVLELREEL